MNLSPARSRSPVVTPGRHIPRSIARQPATISPASAITSISSGVLRTIIGLELQAGERGANLVTHLLGVARSVDAPQHALAIVVVDQGLRLLLVLLQAVLDDLGLVVLALDQAAAVHVAAF